MHKAATAYLKKRAVHEQWPLSSPSGEGVEMVVVIPVLAEFDRLFLTLDDLAHNDERLLARTLVICVVNNRVAEIAGSNDCADNQRTLTRLPEFSARHPRLRLIWVDAASPGCELGPKDGVGMARKIGLDWGVQIVLDGGKPHAPLVSLDADTRVAPGYLAAIRTFFASKSRWAAVIDYAHPVAGSGDEIRAILAYEFFLRYQELALHYAQSPYYYPAIGSTMVCTATAYIASGGMNRRQAGEDFYFLQQLAKTGRIDRIRESTVIPASRASHRVPFGTGRKVGAFVGDEADAYQVYHPATYAILGRWLRVAQKNLEQGGDVLYEEAKSIDTELGHFLEQQGFASAWDKIQRQCKTPDQRLRQFHGWFDGFRTLKLTHHLRDHGYPRQDLFAALGQMMGKQGIEVKEALGKNLRYDLDAQRRLLNTLRRWRA